MILRVPEWFVEAVDRVVTSLVNKVLERFAGPESPYVWHEWRAWRPVMFVDHVDGALNFVWGGKGDAALQRRPMAAHNAP